MAPFISPSTASNVGLASRHNHEPVRGDYTTSQVIVEAWAQGFNFGALIILILFVLCNYRRGILLHKLILLELLLALGHSVFIFFRDPTYGWVLSSTASPLYISYTLHNVIAWLKIRPFLPQWGGRFFIFSLLAVQPYWVLEAFANFQYFNIFDGDIFEMSRFFEPLARDPWWIFTTIKLCLVINKNYEYTFPKLISTSPRFGIMLFCMLVSIAFLVVDVIATALISNQSGINPFWRLALVFKCASDTIFLDDFKSVLDRIAESAIQRVTHLYPGGTDGPASSGRKPSNADALAAPGTSVTISARRSIIGSGTTKKKGWNALRSLNRDSDEHAILGGEAGLEGQPRIVAKTTITVSKQAGQDDSLVSSEASGSRAQTPAMREMEKSHDWANGRPRTGTSSIEPQDDEEQGIPMKPWGEREGSV